MNGVCPYTRCTGSNGQMLEHHPLFPFRSQPPIAAPTATTPRTIASAGPLSLNQIFRPITMATNVRAREDVPVLGEPAGRRRCSRHPEVARGLVQRGERADVAPGSWRNQEDEREDRDQHAPEQRQRVGRMDDSRHRDRDERSDAAEADHVPRPQRHSRPHLEVVREFGVAHSPETRSVSLRTRVRDDATEIRQDQPAESWLCRRQYLEAGRAQTEQLAVRHRGDVSRARQPVEEAQLADDEPAGDTDSVVVRQPDPTDVDTSPCRMMSRAPSTSPAAMIRSPARNRCRAHLAAIDRHCSSVHAARNGSSRGVAPVSSYWKNAVAGVLDERRTQGTL